MVLMTYKIPESIREIALQGEFDEFDLNEFFAAEGIGPLAAFKHKDYVQRWLDLIRGAYLPAAVDEMKLGGERRPPMPYRDARLLGALQHTLWFLPGVASCDAMENLLAERQNSFYHDYSVANCSGARAGVGLAALPPVLAKMGPDPLAAKSITLTCGKLTTGVTVRPWSGIFMLRNLKSPETYFQAAFRVQSPWTVREGGRTRILKEVCYIFDFAIDRALKQVADYGAKLDVTETSAERKVAEFIKFLPVLAFDGASMRQADAEDILNFVATGTSATLLARRWESALLVNVDDDTLKKLLDSEEAMAALGKIEAFRSLNQDLTMIINKSEAVKKAKKEGRRLTEKQKKALTEAEKEYKSKRREIQEKLIKFATRIPIFMYLTDFREETLKDVVTQLEPGLFRKVTGLEIKDFNLLVELNVFNSSLMNDAIFKFRRYEDSSLSYAGVNRHDADERVGGFDAVLSKEEFHELTRRCPVNVKERIRLTRKLFNHFRRTPGGILIYFLPKILERKDTHEDSSVLVSASYAPDRAAACRRARHGAHDGAAPRHVRAGASAYSGHSGIPRLEGLACGQRHESVSRTAARHMERFAGSGGGADGFAGHGRRRAGRGMGTAAR